MGDDRFRELERRWKQTGSVEDEAAYLLERVRMGDLELARLSLLAYCGHAGALKAVGPQEPPRSDDLRDWGDGLQAWGKLACVRVAVAIAEYTRSAVQDEFVWPSGDPVALALDAARAWIESPCAAHAEIAQDAADRSARAMWAYFRSDLRRYSLAGVIIGAAEAAAKDTALEAAHEAGGAAFNAWWNLGKDEPTRSLILARSCEAISG